MLYSISPRIKAYHGTYTENLDSILKNNFLETLNHKMWLGNGIYFFTEGIGSDHPSLYAEQFAIDQCYDSTKKVYTRDMFCVLEVPIKINENKYLNLTEEKGSKLFNEFRDRLVKKIFESGRTIVGDFLDYDILNIMRESLGIEFVKSNLYIKFAAQRILQIKSTIPNVTVLVVNNPIKNIQRSSIKEIKRGNIK